MRITFFILVVFLAGVPGAWAVDYSPTSIQIITGSYVSGNIFSLDSVDLDAYQIEELTGDPCLDVRVNFTGISFITGQTVTVTARYAGNPAHVLNWYLWDGTAWDLANRFEDGEPYQSFTATLAADNVNDGEVLIRFDHISSGAAGHDLYLDQAIFTSVDPVTNSTWFIFALWFVLAGMAYGLKKPAILTIGSITGFYFSFILYPVDPVISLAFLSVNLYTLWDSFDNWDHD